MIKITFTPKLNKSIEIIINNILERESKYYNKEYKLLKYYSDNIWYICKHAVRDTHKCINLRPLTNNGELCLPIEVRYYDNTNLKSIDNIKELALYIENYIEYITGNNDIIYYW